MGKHQKKSKNTRNDVVVSDDNCQCGDNAMDFRAKLALSKQPTSDFVPLESVLEDLTETARSPCTSASGQKRTKKQCCVHGSPCVIADMSASSITTTPSNLSTKSSQHSKNLKAGPDDCCTYYVPHTNSSTGNNAYDRIKEDCETVTSVSTKWKTGWPLTELLYEKKTRADSSKSSSSSFYDDYIKKGTSSRSTTLGRRKSSKKSEKCAEKAGVVETNGYKGRTRAATNSSLDSPASDVVSEQSLEQDWKTDSYYNKHSDPKTEESSPPKEPEKHVFLSLPYADVGICKKRLESNATSPGDALLSTKSSSVPDAHVKKAVIDENEASDLELVCRYYIGHKVKRDAEKGSYAPDSFYLYHQMPENELDLDALRKCIRLYLLYVTPTKEFRHYAILRNRRSKGCTYSVSCHQRKEFDSLSDLVKYYATRKKFSVGGEKQRFPWDK